MKSSPSSIFYRPVPLNSLALACDKRFVLKGLFRPAAQRGILAVSVVLLASCGGGGPDKAGTTVAANEVSSPTIKVQSTSTPAPALAPPTLTPPPPAPTPPPPAPTPSGQPVVSGGNWVVIGSSTAAGSGAYPMATSWAGSLQTRYSGNGVRLINIAKIGTVTYQGLPTSSPPVAFRPGPDPSGNVDAALANSPKLILVAYPNNDTAGNYTVSETVGNLIKIRDYARQRGAAVIIVSTQPRNDLTDAQIAKLTQVDGGVSAQASPCFVPVRAALAGPDGRLAPQYDSGDGVHPNNAGHAVIFNKISALVDSGSCVRL